MRRRFLNFFRHLCCLTVFASIATGVAQAQDVKVRGGFLSDSIKIGEQTAFFLAAEYPAELNVLFPDSTFSFAPFEFQKKTFQPTSTKDGRSYDTTLYYLTTFEIDSVQSLALPVYLLQQGDCTIFLSNSDRVQLVELVKSVPDSVSADKLPLLASVDYYKVKFELNFIIILIITGVVLVVAIVVWIVFGKRIARHFKAKRLEKRHRDFLAAYDRVVLDVKKRFSASGAENALSVWKKYMENLDGRPYTKLTTRETLALQKDERLGNNLRNIDRAIYGHDNAVNDSLDYLKSVADQRFSKKIQEVRHGK